VAPNLVNPGLGNYFLSAGIPGKIGKFLVPKRENQVFPLFYTSQIYVVDIFLKPRFT